MENKLRLVKCKKCNWVYFGVTKKFAQDGIDTFNEFYDNADDEVKSHYNGKSSMSDYDTCYRCGNDYKNFEEAKNGDVPSGCTISPMIFFDEE